MPKFRAKTITTSEMCDGCDDSRIFQAMSMDEYLTGGPGNGPILWESEFSGPAPSESDPPVECVGCGTIMRTSQLPGVVVETVETMYVADGLAVTERRTPAREWTAERVGVSADGPDGRTYSVDVTGPETVFGGTRPSRVNWGAYGSVDREDGLVMAKLLAHAWEIAPNVAPATGAQPKPVEFVDMGAS